MNWPSELSRALIGCALVVFLAGCSPKINKAALGKWRTESSNETLEFSSDGTCQGHDRYGREVSGKYVFIDADHVKLELTTSSQDQARGVRMVDHATGVARIRIQGDELSLIDEGGSATRYRRQK
jgi:hypothetical protein